MKYHQLSRLFVKNNLRDNIIILSNLTDIHYLVKVMRKRLKVHVLLFNGTDGEYLCEITNINPKEISFKPLKQMNTPKLEKEINLIFAPIKHNRMQFLLEKTTELGVTKFTPIITKHSVIDKINTDKWNIYIKDAIEQCRRLSLPPIAPLTALKDLLTNWPHNEKIYLCNENEKSLSFATINKDYPTNIMIGPEGGFSETELELLKSYKFITSVHLGENILRTETAAISAVVLSSL